MSDTFIFDQALRLIKQGKRLRRKEWKNANCVFFVDGSKFAVNRQPLLKFFSEGTEINYRPHIDMIGSEEP